MFEINIPDIVGKGTRVAGLEDSHSTDHAIAVGNNSIKGAKNLS